MGTDSVKWHMLNGGLDEKKTRFRSCQSRTYTDRENHVTGEPVIEQFRLIAPDGSEFLVSIVRLKGPEPF